MWAEGETKSESGERARERESTTERLTAQSDSTGQMKRKRKERDHLDLRSPLAFPFQRSVISFSTHALRLDVYFESSGRASEDKLTANCHSSELCSKRWCWHASRAVHQRDEMF